MKSVPLYKIRDWKSNFESYESKRVKKLLNWVAMPTKHDGKSFRRLMRIDPSGALFGAWCILVQVAAKCPVRGILADSDGPLSAQDISDKTSLSIEVIEMALTKLSSPEISWLESDNLVLPSEELKEENTKNNTHIQVPADVRENAGTAAEMRAEPNDQPAQELTEVNKKENARFVKPTVNEVAEYCATRSNDIDAETFIDHYEANGWKVGGKAPMKNWKAAVRTWEKNDFNRPSPKKAASAFYDGINDFLEERQAS